MPQPLPSAATSPERQRRTGLAAAHRHLFLRKREDLTNTAEFLLIRRNIQNKRLISQGEVPRNLFSDVFVAADQIWAERFVVLKRAQPIRGFFCICGVCKLG